MKKKSLEQKEKWSILFPGYYFIKFLKCKSLVWFCTVKNVCIMHNL